MRGSGSRGTIHSMEGMSSVVEESTLSSAEPGSFREGLCEAALRQCMRKHLLLGRLLDDRRPPGYLLSGVRCSLGLSL